MFGHRVGELMRSQGLTYSRFARATDIGMATAKQLYENPYYQMSTSTLYRCCKFFGVQPGDLLVEIEPETA
jgi:DNA-binding Xre family transcriptional regulator